MRLQAGKVECITKMHRNLHPIKCDECFQYIGTGSAKWIIQHVKKKRILAQFCSKSCAEVYLEDNVR